MASVALRKLLILVLFGAGMGVPAIAQGYGSQPFGGSQPFAGSMPQYPTVVPGGLGYPLSPYPYNFGEYAYRAGGFYSRPAYTSFGAPVIIPGALNFFRLGPLNVQYWRAPSG